MNSQDQDTDNI